MTAPVRERRAGDPVWLELPSGDVASSVAFYTGLFGWVAGEPQRRFGGYRSFTLDGRRVGGVLPGDDTGWLVYLRVEDAAAAAEAVRAAGGVVESGPDPAGALGTSVFVTDPSGARLALWEPARHAGFDVVGVPGAPCWFELHTTHYDASLQFARDALGWEPVSVARADTRMVVNGPPWRAEAGILDAAGDAHSTASAWVPCFAVGDVDAAAGRVAPLGGSLLDDPTDTTVGRMAHAVDPRGARFALMHPADRSRSPVA